MFSWYSFSFIIRIHTTVTKNINCVYIKVYIHCVFFNFRGTSSNNKMSAFREVYSKLHELRSLTPSAGMLALTATATSTTKQAIIEILAMESLHIIYKCPSKENIAYSVYYMEKGRSPEDYFGWLIKELEELRDNTTRTIIYCQTIKQCGLIYSTFKAILGCKFYLNGESDPDRVLVEMLHSCSPEKNKQLILKAFQDENSPIRVLVATMAFGMGVDCKGVNRTIHFGPSKTVKAYIQESGRAGRNGNQSVEFVMYQGLLLNHVDKQMKNYVKTKDCRRKTLLQSFDNFESMKFPDVKHLCCDNCAVTCNCSEPDCGKLLAFPCDVQKEESSSPSTSRPVSAEQTKTVQELLKDYQRSLVQELVEKLGGQSFQIANPQFLLGFS